MFVQILGPEGFQGTYFQTNLKQFVSFKFGFQEPMHNSFVNINVENNMQNDKHSNEENARIKYDDKMQEIQPFSWFRKMTKILEMQQQKKNLVMCAKDFNIPMDQKCIQMHW